MSNIKTHNKDPYVDGSQPTFMAGKRIAVAEGWATFVEFKAMDYYYGQAWGDVLTGTTYSNEWVTDVPTYLEGFDVYDTPMFTTRRDDKSWFLHGLFYDILDNQLGSEQTNATSFRFNGNNLIINNIFDPLSIGSNNSLFPVYNLLKSDVHDACDLRGKLLANYPSEIFNINQLFFSYGYCGEIKPK